MLRIFVVDDSTWSRSIAVNAVKAIGGETRQASNSKETLESIERQKPDFVITDFLMPVLGGFELIEPLREQRIELPVIIVSTDVQVSSRVRGDEIGCIAFLRKPISVSEPSRVLQNIFTHGGVA
jgi:CheY-like chemotaxis protein